MVIVKFLFNSLVWGKGTVDGLTGTGPKCGNFCIPRAGHQRTLTAGETLDNDMARMTLPAAIGGLQPPCPPNLCNGLMNGVTIVARMGALCGPQSTDSLPQGRPSCCHCRMPGLPGTKTDTERPTCGTPTLHVAH